VVVKLHGPRFLSMLGEELETPFGRERLNARGSHFVARPSFLRVNDFRSNDCAICIGPKLQAHIVNPMTLSKEAPIWKLIRPIEIRSSS